MKSYKNIGLLDLRRATDADLNEIESIKNIGTVVVLETQLGKLGHIRQINVGSVMSLPEGVKLVIQNGAYVLTKTMMESMVEPNLFVINGKFKLEPIEDAKLLDKIYKAVVNGKCIALEEDMGMLSGKIQVNGEMLVYKKGERVVEGNFKVEDDAFYGIKPNTRLLVDRLIALQPFNEARFNETIANIRVNDTLVMSKSLIGSIAPKVENYLEVEKVIVESGYAYFDKLTLDESNYQTLSSDKIHVSGKLIIDVPVLKLKEKVSRIICKTLEVNETELEAIRSLIERADKIKTVDPNMMQNYSALKISAEYLESLQTLKLANYGALAFDSTVTEAMIEEKVEKLENYGVLSCSQAIHGAIMKKLTANFGLVQAKDASDGSKSVECGDGEDDDQEDYGDHNEDYDDDDHDDDDDDDDDHDDDAMSNLGSYSY